MRREERGDGGGGGHGDEKPVVEIRGERCEAPVEKMRNTLQGFSRVEGFLPPHPKGLYPPLQEEITGVKMMNDNSE